MKLDLEYIRQFFPILKTKAYGYPLVYLDNAATTQKPQSVIDALLYYYTHLNANVHRANHYLAHQATVAMEETRKSVQTFIHAKFPEEIIFTTGTTASINLVASSYGNQFIGPEDEIVVSTMEHHSNVVPWQICCKAKGAQLKFVPINEHGELELTHLKKILTYKTKLVAITYVSNNLGTINPVQQIIAAAHQVGAKVLIDAAQAAAHLPIDVQALDCDFLAFSGHKLYGPTGVGVLYGKKDILEAMPPYQSGGEMVKTVNFKESIYHSLPYKFEAGTPNIANIIAFKEAINFIKQIDYSAIMVHENELLQAAEKGLSALQNVHIVGQASQKIGIVSFTIHGLHHVDAGLLLDAQGIAVRTGSGCAQPLMEQLGITGVVRVSFGIYNTLEEVERLIKAVSKLRY